MFINSFFQICLNFSQDGCFWLFIAGLQVYLPLFCGKLFSHKNFLELWGSFVSFYLKKITNNGNTMHTFGFFKGCKKGFCTCKKIVEHSVLPNYVLLGLDYFTHFLFIKFNWLIQLQARCIFCNQLLYLRTLIEVTKYFFEFG